MKLISLLPVLTLAAAAAIKRDGTTQYILSVEDYGIRFANYSENGLYAQVLLSSVELPPLVQVTALGQLLVADDGQGQIVYGQPNPFDIRGLLTFGVEDLGTQDQFAVTADNQLSFFNRTDLWLSCYDSDQGITVLGIRPQNKRFDGTYNCDQVTVRLSEVSS